MASAPTRAGRTGTYLTTQTPYDVTVTYGDSKAAAPKEVPGSAWFGPLQPLVPIAPEGVDGRQFDFPSGYNLNTTARVYKGLDFPTLRAMADSWDLLRLVIETRKDQAKRLRWSVQPKDRHTRKNVDSQIKTVTDFFKKPDGYHTFSEWLGILLEDLFVIDAPTLYKQRNRAGQLIELLPIDGATIKPVIDNFGRTPRPYKRGRGMIYPVAYQQILKGYPALDYSLRDLIYKPRNVRVNTVYGYSPVEQIVATVTMALRRQSFTTAYFTEGNIPDSLIGVPDNWTPDQIAVYQKYWDAYFEGDDAKRRKAKFVPGGVAKTFIQTKEPDLKAEFDDWLARLVCFAFSVSNQALIKQVNRAASQTQKAQAEEEGLVPIMAWIKELIDGVVQDELHAPDVEFTFTGEDSVDESTQAVILDGYVKAGVLSINEVRVKIGQDPMPDPDFSQPMVYTALGYVPIGANTIDGMKEKISEGIMPQSQPPGAGGGSAPQGTGAGKPAATKPKAQDGPGETARKLLEDAE